MLLRWITLSLTLFFAFQPTARAADFTGNLDGKTLYELLGVDPKASADEVQKAVRAGLHKFHPDRNGGDEIAKQKYQVINNAKEVLTDADRRKLYDAMLKYAAKNDIDLGFADQQVNMLSRFFGRHGKKPIEEQKSILGNAVSKYVAKDFDRPAYANAPTPKEPTPETEIITLVKPPTSIMDKAEAAAPRSEAPASPASTRNCRYGMGSLVKTGIAASAAFGLVTLAGHSGMSSSNESKGETAMPMNSAMPSGGAVTAAPSPMNGVTAPDATRTTATPPAVPEAPAADPVKNRGQSFRDKLKGK